MRVQRVEITYNGVPSERFRTRPFIWLIWAVATFTMLLCASVWFALGSDVERQAVYTGTLRLKGERRDISLPAGAILKRVEVQENQSLRKGQTVLTLDVEAMRRLRSELLEKQSANGFFLNCLGSYREPPEHLETDTQTALFTKAAAECDRLHDGSKNEIALLKKQAASLLHERHILDRYIAFLVSTKKEPSEEIAEKALKLSLASKRLNQKSLELAQTIESRERNARALISWALKQALEKSGALENQITSLDKHIKAPRVEAPDEAQVTRVRKYRENSARFLPTSIVEVMRAQSAVIIAEFTVPQEHEDTLTIGTEVVLQLLGLEVETEFVKGTVKSISPERSGALNFLVSLKLNDQKKLRESDLYLSLISSESAVEVKIRKSTEPLKKSLQEIAMRVLPGKSFLSDPVRSKTQKSN